MIRAHALLNLTLVALLAGCPGKSQPDGGVDAGVDGGTPAIDAGEDAGIDAGPACDGLQCSIHSCADGGSTTISGTIYDPAGKNQIYGVVAYVPNGTPEAITPGAACVSCDDLYTGTPLAADISKRDGTFMIEQAPDGMDIPLVIQIGKWRRQFTIPSVARCTDTVPPMVLSLPANGTEGDMPQIAISTGAADTLECLLTRMGVDESEYVPGNSGAGHIHIFQGQGGPNTSPAAPVSSQALWNMDQDIMPYDLTLLSCEGATTTDMNQQVLLDYTESCGRVLASHFHYAWFYSGPFATYDLADWTPGSNQIGASLNADVVTSFAAGEIFQQWLDVVNAGANGGDELTIYAPRHNADVSAANTDSQAWLQDDNSSQAPGAAQIFTFDTPLDQGASTRLGRVAYTDMHVGAVPPGVTADYESDGGTTTPGGCAQRDLTSQEKALEFFLFNLSSCVTPGGGLQAAPTTLGPP